MLGNQFNCFVNVCKRKVRERANSGSRVRKTEILGLSWITNAEKTFLNKVE